jgi:nucleotide-binding universal stress UspA family protein
MFNKILLAADGSKHSIRATEKAIELAQINSESMIHVIYVVDGDDVKTDVLHNWNTADISFERKKLIAPVEEKLKASLVKYEIKSTTGIPGPTIVKYANDNKFDLIVIGSRGLNPLQQLVLGSVSHKVAKRANCSVLIVKINN